MFKQLDDYNWAEVFGERYSLGKPTPNRHPNDKITSNASFSREDVETIHGLVEGEHDGPSWVVYGQLTDKRYFVARGGCDYTGWDCQAGNSADVASSLEDIIRFGLDDDERSRLGVQL